MRRLSMTVGIVVSGELSRVINVKTTGPRPRIPSNLLRRPSEATPIIWLWITTQGLRVRVSVYKFPNISINMTTYDIFVCHTDEGFIILESNRHRLIHIDTGAGRHVLGSGANPSVRASRVDKQIVCIRQSIDSRNCFSRLYLQMVLPMPTR